MTEEGEFQHDIIAECKRLHLLVHHSTDPTKDVGRGFPDLVIAGSGGFVIAELKVPGGRMSPAQTDWAWKLRAGGAPYEVWTPDRRNTIKWKLREMARLPL